MTKSVMVGAVALLAIVSVSDAAEWKIDPAHSSVSFEVKHLVISKIRGNFKDFSGDLTFDRSNLEAGKVSVSVKAASINTGNEDRDKHLRTDEFLAADKHPTMTFKSTGVVSGSDGEFKLVGDLTIRGATKEVTFDCEFHGIAQGPMGNTKAGFSAETVIDRQDFSVSWSKSLDTGGLVVGNDVKIILDFEFDMAG